MKMRYASKQQRDKLLRGIKKKYFRQIFSKEAADHLVWASLLQPGDLFHACDGWNHKVSTVEVEWSEARDVYPKIGPRTGKIVTDVTIIAEGGHSADAFNCAGLPKSANEISEYWKGWVATEAGVKIAQAYWPKLTTDIIDRILKELPLCDDVGIQLAGK